MTADRRPVRVETVGSVTASTVAWRYKERLHVSVIAKATFVMRPGAEMILADPEPLSRAELHHRNSPTQSVRVTSDLVPYLHQADVVLTGHACAPRGRPASMVAARLTVRSGHDHVLLDKTLHVHGDRRDANPQPFERIPLVYERAIGGIGWDENPLGVGMKAGHPPDPLAATIVSPDDPMQSAGFGPISRAWPSRKRLLGGLDRKALDLPIAEIPDAFDWSYFQAAPLDQRVDHLRGDEWIELEGMDPDHFQLTSRLPRVRALAHVIGLDAAQPWLAENLELRADRLHIDADSLQCSVVWRGVLSMPGEEALETASVIVGLELAGEPVEWPTNPMPRVKTQDPPWIDTAAPGLSAKADPSVNEAAKAGKAPQPSAEEIDIEDEIEDEIEILEEVSTELALDETQWELATEQLGYKRNAPSGPPKSDPSFDPTQWETTTEQLGFRRPETSANPASPRPFDESQWETSAAPIGLKRTRPPPAAPPAVALPVAAPPAVALPVAAPPTSSEDAQWGTPTAPLMPEDLASLRRRPDTPFATIPDIDPRPSDPKGPIPGAPWSSTSMVPTIQRRSEEDDQPPPASYDFDETYPPRVRPSAPPAAPAARMEVEVEAEAEAAPAIAGTSRIEGAIPIVNRTPLAAFTFLPWQPRPGRYARAVAIKASFDIEPSGRVKLRPQADPPSIDVHAEGDPMKSVLYPTDFASFKPKADVTLKGHAHAPSGALSASQSRVRFRFGRPGNGFDRSIAVFGDRRREQSAASSGALPAPSPFKAIPLVYERAYGGPGFDENPTGLGRVGAALPNLEDPAHLLTTSPPSPPPPACFCAIPSMWEARSSKLSTFGAGAREDGEDGEEGKGGAEGAEGQEKDRWPASLPRDFDWSFFQSAPLAQQLDYLDGDEPFELVGMRPDSAIVMGALPGARPRCFAQKARRAGGLFEEVPLLLDTATFDADEMKLHLVWRGLIQVRDDDASDVAELFVLLEGPGDPRADLEEARTKYLMDGLRHSALP